jgi:hypothetical protein
MQSHLNQNMKSAQTRERMQQKLEQRRAAMVVQAQAAALNQTPIVFSTGEKVERTPRGSAAPAAIDAAAIDAPPSAPNKKKNKNKK